jgi:1-acyl-sn-glycerol-3-phosphate acyltransferase
MALARTFTSTQKLTKATSSNRNLKWDDPAIASVTQQWAQGALKNFNVSVKVIGTPTSEPAIYVGNHLSYLDIVALYSIKHLCFVSKAEVGKWPIIGSATHAAGTIFVERGSVRSRVETADVLGRAVAEEQKSVCIFPEGTTSVQGKNWRRGVFRVAQERNLWVQPLGLMYKPARRAAYIDDDTLLSHMWNLISYETTELTVKFFPARKINDADLDMNAIQKEVRAWADAELAQQGYFDSEIGYEE